MDVLGEIFSFTAMHIMVLYRSRIVICAVSRRWREIALAHPRLWSYLVLDMTLRYPPIPILRLWLERSANAPLELSFANMGILATFMQQGSPWEPQLSIDPDTSKQYQYARNAFSALVIHIHHWAKVRFFDLSKNHTSIRVARLLKNIPFNRAVQLRNLNLTSLVSGVDEEGIISAVSQVPGLEKFHLMVSNDTHIANGTISFPWDRLKDLHLSNIRTGDLNSIIQRCASAITIYLHTRLSTPLQPQLQTTISLSALRGLSLLCYRDAFSFIGQLECPHLEVLHLKLCNELQYPDYGHEEHPDSYPEFWNDLFSFLSGSKHSLRVLLIEDPDELFTEGGLSTFLKIPRLAELIALKVVVVHAGWVWDAIEVTDSLPVGELLQLDEVMTRDGEDVLHLGWALDGCLQEFFRERPYIKDLSIDENVFLKG